MLPYGKSRSLFEAGHYRSVNTTHADKPGHLTAEWFGAQTLLQASIATAFASFRT
jgi:hypothetical protein